MISAEHETRTYGNQPLVAKETIESIRSTVAVRITSTVGAG